MLLIVNVFIRAISCIVFNLIFLIYCLRLHLQWFSIVPSLISHSHLLIPNFILFFHLSPSCAHSLHNLCWRPLRVLFLQNLSMLLTKKYVSREWFFRMRPLLWIWLVNRRNIIRTAWYCSIDWLVCSCGNFILLMSFICLAGGSHSLLRLLLDLKQSNWRHVLPGGLLRCALADLIRVLETVTNFINLNMQSQIATDFLLFFLSACLFTAPIVVKCQFLLNSSSALLFLLCLFEFCDFSVVDSQFPLVPLIILIGFNLKPLQFLFCNDSPQAPDFFEHIQVSYSWILGNYRWPCLKIVFRIMMLCYLPLARRACKGWGVSWAWPTRRHRYRPITLEGSVLYLLSDKLGCSDFHCASLANIFWTCLNLLKNAWKLFSYL